VCRACLWSRRSAPQLFNPYIAFEKQAVFVALHLSAGRGGGLLKQHCSSMVARLHSHENARSSRCCIGYVNPNALQFKLLATREMRSYRCRNFPRSSRLFTARRTTA